MRPRSLRNSSEVGARSGGAASHHTPSTSGSSPEGPNSATLSRSGLLDAAPAGRAAAASSTSGLTSALDFGLLDDVIEAHVDLVGHVECFGLDRVSLKHDEIVEWAWPSLRQV